MQTAVSTFAVCFVALSTVHLPPNTQVQQHAHFTTSIYKCAVFFILVAEIGTKTYMTFWLFVI